MGTVQPSRIKQLPQNTRQEHGIFIFIILYFFILVIIYLSTYLSYFWNISSCWNNFQISPPILGQTIPIVYVN